MDRMFLAAAALRLIAQDLIARKPVEAEQLVALGTAYVELDLEAQSLRERVANHGRKAAEPTTEDGKLVAAARASLAKLWGKPCTMDALAKYIAADRTQLSRCNGASGIPLSPALRDKVCGVVEAGAPGARPSE